MQKSAFFSAQDRKASVVGWPLPAAKHHVATLSLLTPKGWGIEQKRWKSDNSWVKIKQFNKWMKEEGGKKPQNPNPSDGLTTL